jgi:serine/threonine-protein kinase
MNAMYLKCDEENVCDPPRASSSRTRPSYYGNHEFDEYPVIHVSWVDAKSYCEWAGRRLPTEAEWEKAARGTDGRIYPWGNDAPTINLANFGGLLGDTTSVTDYVEGASPYRSLNMAGNVWEWVADFYELSYYGKSRASNPPGPLAGENRVMRGGSWTDYASTVKSTHRYGNYPLDTSSFIGFRCARSQ